MVFDCGRVTNEQVQKGPSKNSDILETVEKMILEFGKNVFKMSKDFPRLFFLTYPFFRFLFSIF